MLLLKAMKRVMLTFQFIFSVCLFISFAACNTRNPSPAPHEDAQGVSGIVLATYANSSADCISQIANGKHSLKCRVVVTENGVKRIASDIAPNVVFNWIGSYENDLQYCSTSKNGLEFNCEVPVELEVFVQLKISDTSTQEEKVVEAVISQSVQSLPPTPTPTVSPTPSPSLIPEPAPQQPPPTEQPDENFIITPVTGLQTSERGATAQFTIRLAIQPAGTVIIGLSSSDLTEGTVSPSSVTFNPANWNINQTVTVSGVMDSVVDGNIDYRIITAPAAGTDVDYFGRKPADISVTNTDNSTTNIFVTPTTGRVTSESGTSTNFTVQLTSQPSASVTIPLSSSNTNEGTVSPSSLTFNNSNWNSPQTVMVTGVDDLVIDGAISYSIDFGTTVSSDPNYNNLNPSDVSVVNNDNDTPNISLAASPASVLENSGSPIAFTFTRSGIISSSLSVNFNVSGSATYSTDYNQTGANTFSASSGTINFAPGSATAILSITPIADSFTELDETVSIQIAAGTGYGITTASPVVATITNDDYGVFIDNGDAGFASSGFIAGTGGYKNNILYNVNNPGPTVFASWTFNNLQAGTYKVSATWYVGVNPNAVTNAAYKIDVGAWTYTKVINQTQAPSTFAGSFRDAAPGIIPVYFADLHSTVSVAANGTIVVSLPASSTANKFIIADAIRIERTEP